MQVNLKQLRSRALLMAVACLSQTPSGSNAAPDRQTQFVFFGTYTGPKSQGIYRSEFDPKTGELSSFQLAAKTRNPTFLALDPEKRVLYAVNEINDFGHKNSGAVSAFRLDRKKGNLVLLNQVPSGGAGPCHLAVAPDGTCVLVANYGSGSFAVLPREADGRLAPPSDVQQHRGSSVNPQRQEAPHAHFVTWSPDARVVLGCDLGLDQVSLYRLDEKQRMLLPNEPALFSISAGSGPRHLAFHPSGKYVYILNELSSTMTCCSYDHSRGVVREVQTVSTLPSEFNGQNTCAEIQIHPSGKTIYASNRGHNSIAVFAVDASSGAVKLVQNESTQGKTPRHFCLDPSGHWLLAENQDSDNVVVFRVEPDSRRLATTGQSRALAAPVCAVFVAKR